MTISKLFHLLSNCYAVQLDDELSFVTHFGEEEHDAHDCEVVDISGLIFAKDEVVKVEVNEHSIDMHVKDEHGHEEVYTLKFLDVRNFRGKI